MRNFWDTLTCIKLKHIDNRARPIRMSRKLKIIMSGFKNTISPRPTVLEFSGLFEGKHGVKIDSVYLMETKKK